MPAAAFASPAALRTALDALPLLEPRGGAFTAEGKPRGVKLKLELNYRWTSTHYTCINV